MVSLVQSVVEGLNHPHISWREYKIKTREGLALMGALGLHNIPTICINGHSEFVSITPSKEAFIQALKPYLP